MTREERHIAVLSRLLESMDVYDSIQPTEERKKAIKAAIKALSQEPICDRDCEHCTWTECPIEPCDDAISREAVYQLLMDMASSAYGFEEIRKIVDDLPSVTQKSGKWIRWREEIQRGTHYTENVPHCKCSECDKEYDTYASRFINYCPNCGAKMESEE